MAKITVKTPAAVMYDGRLLYPSDTAYAVNDTYANYVKATADQSAELITITEAFTITDATNRFGKGYKVTKTITYTGEPSYAAFSVTGLVAVKIIGRITASLTNDSAVTSVGIPGGPGVFIPATAGTAMQTVGQFWNTSTPANTVPLDPVYYLTDKDIVVTGDANLIAGKVELYCYWYPISEDGAVVAAK